MYLYLEVWEEFEGAGQMKWETGERDALVIVPHTITMHLDSCNGPYLRSLSDLLRSFSRGKCNSLYNGRESF